MNEHRLGRTGPILEGAMLVALGLAMGALILSGNYWLYINPKFQWLTATTAGLLVLVGVASALQPPRPVNRSGVLIFLAFLCYTIWGNFQVLAPPPPDLLARPTPPPPHSREDEKARETLNGIEYIRINTGELFNLCEDKGVDAGAHYTLQGMVVRTPELDRAGQFIVARLAVFCCFADAVAVGFRTSDPNGRSGLKNGEWVQIYGRLEGTSNELPQPEITFEGAVATAVHPRSVIIPEKTVPIAAPEIPFIFEFREAEPFAF